MIPLRRRPPSLQERCQFVVLRVNVAIKFFIVILYGDTDIWVHRVRHRAEGQGCPLGTKRLAPLPPAVRIECKHSQWILGQQNESE